MVFNEMGSKKWIDCFLLDLTHMPSACFTCGGVCEREEERECWGFAVLGTGVDSSSLIAFS